MLFQRIPDARDMPAPRSLDRLERAAKRLPHETKPMFGGHGIVAANGAMFAGVWDKGRILVKVRDEEARAKLLAAGGETWVQRGPSRTRAMPTWVVVPEAVAADARRLAAWVRRAHEDALQRRP